MKDIDWSITSNDTDKKIVYLNSLSKEELIIFFSKNVISYLSLLETAHLNMILDHPLIQERILNSASKWLVGSITLSAILSRLTGSNFVTLMNENMLELIKESPRRQSFVLDVISNNNSNISYHLEETKFFDLIANNDEYTQLYEKMSVETAVCYFKYILKKDEEKIENVSSLSTKTQWAVISSIGLPEFYQYFTKYELIFTLDNSTIKKLIENPPYYQYFIHMPSHEIEGLINSGLHLPNSMSTDKTLIRKLSSMEDPNKYRLLCNKLMYSSTANPLYLKSKEYMLAREYHIQHDMPLTEVDLTEVSFDEEDPKELTFDHLYLEEQRKRYYDNLVASLKEYDYMLPEFYNIKIGKIEKDKRWLLNYADDDIRQRIKAESFTQADLDALLLELSTTRLLEILCDRYFEDITYNFLINIGNLLSFYDSIDLSILGLNNQELNELQERIKLYQAIYSFYDLNPEDQVKLYNSFDKSIDYATLFYDDMYLAKHTAYDLMNKYAFTPEKGKDLLNVEMSKKLGVEVYELTGQPFYAYVHVTRHSRDEHNLTSIWEDIQDAYIRNPVSLEGTKSGTSISFMNDKKLDIGPDGRKPNRFITIGFNFLEPNRIAHVAYGDSWSEFYRSGVGTARVSEIMTPETLLEKTRNYNEVLYQEITPLLFDDDVQKQYTKLKPDYFVCYDEIQEEDIKLAKMYKIPILLVRTTEYDFVKDDYSFFGDPHQYKTMDHQLEQVITYRRK